MRFRAIALAVICAVIGAAMITGGATAGHNDGKKHKVKKKKKKQQKISICHRTGNGSYVLIRVGFPALQAHSNHGDKFPTNGSCEQPVEPQPVTSGPVLDFGPNGWAGWSCPLNMRAVGGTHDLVDVHEAFVAQPGVTVDGYTYPVFPHYTFDAAAGETGFVVHNDDDQELDRTITVFCVPK
jgi:hypothetical protein